MDMGQICPDAQMASFGTRKCGLCGGGRPRRRADGLGPGAGFEILQLAQGLGRCSVLAAR